MESNPKDQNDFEWELCNWIETVTVTMVTQPHYLALYN